MVNIIQRPKKVKTRKNHICQGCGDKINKEDIVYSSKYANEDTAWNFYECEECWNYFKNNCHECKDFYDCIGENYEIGTIKECKKHYGVAE